MNPKTLFRRITFLLLALTTVVGCRPELASETRADEASPDSAQAGARGPSQEAPAPNDLDQALVDARRTDPDRRRQRLEQKLRAGWWHQPKKRTLLGLTEDQAARIDALMLDYLDAEFQSTAFGEASRRFRRALVDGDRSGARSAADDIAEATRASTRRQSEVIIRSIEILTPEQREKLGEAFPGLLERSWVPVAGLLTTAARARERRERLGEDPAGRIGNE